MTKTIESLKGYMHYTGESGKDDKGRPSRKNIYIMTDKAPKWFKDAVYVAHGDKLPDDFTYRVIADFIDNVEGNESMDDLGDVADNVESDIYASDLTAWLHSRNDRVYYLTEALSGRELKDGFQLLAYAQGIEIREILYSFIDSLEKELF